MHLACDIHAHLESIIRESTAPGIYKVSSNRPTQTFLTMTDVKASAMFPSEKKADAVLALPVSSQAAAHRAQSRLERFPRILKAGFRWAALLAVILSVHLWSTGVLNITGSATTGHKKPLVGKKAEKLFLSIPNEASAIAASRQYASKPHVAGSEGDLTTAKDFLKLLQTELGIEAPEVEPIFPAGSDASRQATLSIPKLHKPQAWIDEYYPYMNTPLDRSLEIIGDDGKVVWKANLEEVADDTDPDAGEYYDAVPAFHGLSVGGEVQGKLVYAHYGRQSDYDDLEAKGVNLTGKIVLTRYGGIFRGLKVKGAQERGAAAVLIYSDIRDDGTVTVANGYAAYPDGPARNPNSVQRGSVSFISLYPGDPTTPGKPAYKNATRDIGGNYPSIPSIPISWANAEVLLKEIGATSEGRDVKLVNHVDDKITPIWNTLGVIPGHIRDEVVVIGNHRDEQVLGATDPTSGTASVHEIIRGFGVLLRSGWRPLRTIVFASWDAEEYALIGSTEWGEDFPEFIDKHVVAYLNLDSSVSGSRFGASASPSLAHVYRQAAEDVPHPTDAGRTLWDARSDSGKLFGNGTEVDSEVLAMWEAEAQALDSIGVSPLGSGSDYTVFLQHLGVASSNGGFGSTLHDPVYHYHSIFDSERWQELYGDPGFFKHVAVAKHLGLMALRIAGDTILPLNTTHYALELERYVDHAENLALTASLSPDLSRLRASIKSLQTASIALDAEKAEAEHDLKKIFKKWKKRSSKLRKLRRKAKHLACKLRKVFGKKFECKKSHACQKSHHELDIKSASGVRLHPRVGRAPAYLKERQEEEDISLAQAFASRLGADVHHFPHPGRKFIKAVRRVQAANKKLVAFERGFIHDEGLKGREFFKHLGVAPGTWLGYGATTLPAVEEALTIEKNATLAELEADRLQTLIEKLEETLQV
ncbi:hypothetical protein PLICRDRAFT_128324, partial [Plicaturopsis crispa FD-325 SS-3]